MAPTEAPIAAPYQAPEPPPAMAPIADPAAAPAAVPYTAPLVVRLCCSQAAQLLSVNAQAVTAAARRIVVDILSSSRARAGYLISYVTCRVALTSTSPASTGGGAAASAIATMPPRA